jgi:peptidoglycan/LPS O-acetylase OafA/YrhL
VSAAEPATPAASARPTIDALTGIRAVAAGWVVFEHFRRPFFALVPALGATEPWAEAG